MGYRLSESEKEEQRRMNVARLWEFIDNEVADDDKYKALEFAIDNDLLPIGLLKTLAQMAMGKADQWRQEDDVLDLI